MSAEQNPRVLRFLSETAPLATAIIGLGVMFACCPTQRPAPVRTAEVSPRLHGTESGSTGKNLGTESSAITKRGLVERLPPIAKCERLPAVDEPRSNEPQVVESVSPPENNQATVPAEVRTAPNNDSSNPSADHTPLPAARIHASLNSPGELDRVGWQANAVPTAGSLHAAPSGDGAAVSLPESVAIQSRERLKQAYGRADRGALFSARREFLLIFRTIAHSLDANLDQPIHTAALSQALCAMDEADDFIAADNYMATPAQMEGLIASHQTSVLTKSDSARLNPRSAMQAYYDFASKNLARAGGSQAIAAEVLYALGRVEMLTIAESTQRTGRAPKAAAYFTAALAIDPHHALAANELGVLLARSGRLQQARAALEHAARSNPTPTILQNLADVQQRIDTSQGRVAAGVIPVQGTQPTSQQVSSALMSRVQFVDPQTFAQLSDQPSAGDVHPVPASGAISSQPGVGQRTQTSDQKSWFGF